MPDVSAKIKGLNVEFNDNLTTSPNINSGDDIKTSFARIHKRFSQMKSAAYIDASISDNKTITLGDSSIGVVSISQNQGLTDIEKTNARTNIGAGTSNFNGSFNSLTNKPTTISGYGITDAFSGSFTDLTNKPTTISGYGITDAKIQNGTITLGSNTITPLTSFSSLDSPLVGGSGKYISSISETDGIISATETTLDTVPTENSTNAITSGAVYTDSANQQLEIDYAINTGSKNLLKVTASSGVLNTATIDIADDGSMHITGQPTSNGAYVLSSGIDLVIPENAYILSMGEEAGNTKMTLSLRRKGTTQYVDLYHAESRIIPSGTYDRLHVYLYADTVYDTNVYPMIRPVDITDDTFQPYAPSNRELYETKTEQIETNVIANFGAKNMLYISNSTGYTTTSHGRTFTVLSDGGIKITGASSDSSNADFYVIGSWGNRSILLNENKDSCLICMKCDTDYGYNQIRLRAMNRSTGSTVNETGVETNKDVQLSHVITTVFISVFPSVTLPGDGVVVYPMIRRAEITDNTFQPYAPTNRELYETKTEQKETNVIANLGAKNLLQYNEYATGAENGVTYTINTDGTLTVSGTPQGSSPSYVELKLNGNAVNVSRFCDGQHILSGCPAGGSDSTYRMYAARSTYSRFDYGDGVLLTDTTLTDVRLVVYIANGYTANNLVFKPMIRQAEITDGTFQPYAPTNRELYEMILALQNGRSVQSVNPTSTLNLSKNDLDESLDTGFESLDSIPEEESESYNIDEELTEEEESE